MSLGAGAAGSITFNADLSYVAQGWESTFHEVTRDSPACLAAATCAEATSTVYFNETFADRTCSGADVCTCETSHQQSVDETGTYLMDGTQFHLTAADATVRTRSYCVEGLRLHIVDVSTTTDAAGNPVIVDDSVAMRE